LGVVRPKFLNADMEEKIALARELMEKCKLCERKCGVNRLEGEVGFCGVKEARISTYFFHYGEEPEIIPSFTIFFSGCNFNCVYCQNWDISQFPERGELVKPKVMARIIEGAYENGAKNVNWVGGEPTPNLLYILEVLKHVRVPIPIIWNSNFYMTRKCMKVLDGVIDIYLPDFKYGNDECALRLSNVPNYFKIVSRNHKLAQKQGELMIRHLVLPNHLECCTKPVLDWIADNLGTDVYLNVMGQYRPEYKAMKFKDIDRRITWKEYEEALEYARKLGFRVRG